MSDLSDLREKIPERLDAAAFYAEAICDHFRGLPHADQKGFMDQRTGFAASIAVSNLLNDVLEDIYRLIDRELHFTVSDDEAVILERFGKKWGCSRDAAATRLIREGLHRLLNPDRAAH